MGNLETEFNPITKLRLFCEVKKIVYKILDDVSITLSRAEEIMNYVKKYIKSVDSPREAKQFYLHLGKKFNELAGIKNKFQFEEEEKIDQIFSLFLHEFMGKGDIELAANLMEQMNKAENSQMYLEKLKVRYPVEFQKAFEKTIGN